mgnify:CR=1 FL=1
MTYLSGDQAYLGEGKDQGEKTGNFERAVFCNGRYSAGQMVRFICNTVDAFWVESRRKRRLLIFKSIEKKHQSSEILCPTPLDLNVNYSDRFEYDPETFLEVSFGEKGETKDGERHCICHAVRNLPLAETRSVGKKLVRKNERKFISYKRVQNQQREKI